MRGIDDYADDLLEPEEKAMEIGAKQYIGVKIVEAEPMNLGDYNSYRGWELPADEQKTADTEGYLVRYPDGYISWCPRAQFEEANQALGEEGWMTFGHAIEAAKKGKRIARWGWNGNGMFVVYQKGYPDGIPVNAQTAKAYNMREGDLFKCRPYLQMRTADGSHVMWVASQADILERDWMVID